MKQAGLRAFAYCLMASIAGNAFATAAPCEKIFLGPVTVPRNSWAVFTESAQHQLAWIEQKTRSFPATLLTAGLVVGDPHPGQFSELVRHDRVRGIALLDLDDGGVAPLISDLIRYRTSLMASEVRQPTEIFMALYKKGLAGVAPRVPAPFAYALGRDSHEIVRKRKKFIRKATIRSVHLDSHKMDLISRDNWSQNDRDMWIESQGALSAALRPRTILDVALKVKKDGGSQGLSRFWLLTNYKGRTEIFEAKSLTQPATGHFQKQTNADDRIALLLEKFWPTSKKSRVPKYQRLSRKRVSRIAPKKGSFDADGEEYKVVTTENYAFWLRPKLPADIDFEEMPPDERESWARYVTQEMGYLHSRNALAPQFLAALKRHDQQMQKVLNDFPRNYLEEIETKKLVTPAR